MDRTNHASNRAIRKPIGKLRIREATVGPARQYFKTLARTHRARARNAKVVLKQMLAMAVRHGAITTNPIATSPPYPAAATVVALATDDLDTVRTAIRRWQQPVPGKSGPHHSSDLADIIEILLATGARIGEILAIRWHDLDLDSPTATLTIRGTLVHVKGKGLFRQDSTKTDAGFRIIVIPQFAIDVLRRRSRTYILNCLHAVFATRNGTWLSPNNVRRQWRQARAETGLDWVTRTPFAKPSPPFSTGKARPKPPHSSLATPTKTSLRSTTSPKRPSHRTSPTSSTRSAPDGGQPQPVSTTRYQLRPGPHRYGIHRRGHPQRSRTLRSTR